jgi:hypothetical protein
VTRPVQVFSPAPRERHGFDQTRSAFPLPFRTSRGERLASGARSSGEPPMTGETGECCSVNRPSRHDSNVLRSPRPRFRAEAPPLEPRRRAPRLPPQPKPRERPVTPGLPIGSPSRRSSAERVSRAVLKPEPQNDPFHSPRHSSSSSRDLSRVGLPSMSTRRPRLSLASEETPSSRVSFTTSRLEPEPSTRRPSSCRLATRRSPKHLFDSSTEDP